LYTVNPTAKTWLDATAAAAKDGGHTWPEYAACEAALESGFGQSLLARADHNLFGTKQHTHPIYGTHNIPTREFLDPDGPGPEDKQWVMVNAAWITYPNFAACFDDRMTTLGRLRRMYPHYDAALRATDGQTFVHEVSQTWSTDPERASKVLDIHNEYFATV
jgi:flagellum-specific peptidoglycan hydrolase FlgJ